MRAQCAVRAAHIAALPLPFYGEGAAIHWGRRMHACERAVGPHGLPTTAVRAEWATPRYDVASPEPHASSQARHDPNGRARRPRGNGYPTGASSSRHDLPADDRLVVRAEGRRRPI
jgi:hypothetical protein